MKLEQAKKVNSVSAADYLTPPEMVKQAVLDPKSNFSEEFRNYRFQMSTDQLFAHLQTLIENTPKEHEIEVLNSVLNFINRWIDDPKIYRGEYEKVLPMIKNLPASAMGTLKEFYDFAVQNQPKDKGTYKSQPIHKEEGQKAMATFREELSKTDDLEALARDFVYQLSQEHIRLYQDLRDYAGSFENINFTKPYDDQFKSKNFEAARSLQAIVDSFDQLARWGQTLMVTSEKGKETEQNYKFLLNVAREFQRQRNS